MKSTGIVRKIDELGRVVLPIDIRVDMDIKKKDPIEIFADGDMIVLQKYYPACTFCGEKERNENKIIQFSGKTVCKTCAQWIAVMSD